MIGPRLHAARYDTARTTMEEFFEQPARIGVRCSLPGWLQRLEVTVKARSKFDAYERYRTHQGDGFALVDSYADIPPVDGWVYEVVPDGRHVHYIVGGAWKRHTDEFETDPPGAVDTDAYLKNTVLPDHVPAVSTDMSNIDATGTSAENVIKLTQTRGDTPQDIIKNILKVGTTNNASLDYWVQSQPFDGVALQAPLPYLKARSESASFDWQVDLRDLRRRQFSRHIWDLANQVRIYFEWYTLLNGAHSAGATAITVDNIANFGPGMRIIVELDNDREHTTFITSATGTTINISEALPHTASDNGLVIKDGPLQNTSNANDTDSQSAYWTRHYHSVERDLRGSDADLTTVHQFRDTILDQLKDPVQQASFSIGSRWIRDGNGVRWPLWRMLQSPGYIRVNDLFPAAALASTSLDQLRAFWTAALDYDHSSRTMTVTPDAYLGDNRLDVLLQRLNLGIGQIVARA